MRSSSKVLRTQSGSLAPLARRPSITLKHGCLFDDAHPVTVMKRELGPDLAGRRLSPWVDRASRCLPGRRTENQEREGKKQD
jgi:hypothetical protein